MDTRFSVLTLPECFKIESRRPMFGELASDGQALSVGGMNAKSLLSVIEVVDMEFFSWMFHISVDYGLVSFLYRTYKLNDPVGIRFPTHT